MKYIGMIGLSVVVAASLSSVVMAEGAKAEGTKAPHKEKQNMFKKADANGDGKLSLDEFKTIAHGDAEKKFTAADTDKDGFLTPEELKAAHAAKKAEKAAAPAVAAPVAPAAAAPVK
ncbi:MAG: EF-hand domain-containing protein [bacterium]